MLWTGLVAILAIGTPHRPSPVALAALAAGPADLAARLLQDRVGCLAQLCALATVLGLIARALDVPLRLLLPTAAGLLPGVLFVWVIDAGSANPEAPLIALLVGLFLAEAAPLRGQPWRHVPSADQTLEAGMLLLALAFPALLALGTGPLSPLHAAAVALGICVTVCLVATTVVGLDNQMTGVRVERSVHG
jgi:hypothetical protein